jgi:hypothetical protein
VYTHILSGIETKLRTLECIVISAVRVVLLTAIQFYADLVDNTICIVLTGVIAPHPKCLQVQTNNQHLPVTAVESLEQCRARDILPDCQNATINTDNTPSDYSVGREEFQYSQKIENLSAFYDDREPTVFLGTSEHRPT